MYSDYLELKNKGLPLPEIMATLADKYEYSIPDAIAQGKSREQIFTEIVMAKPKGGVLSAAATGVARGIIGDLPKIVGGAVQALGQISDREGMAQTGKAIKDFGTAQIEKIEALSPEYKDFLPKAIHEGMAMLAPSIIPSAGIGATAYNIGRLFTTVPKALSVATKAGIIGGSAIHGLSAGQQAYEDVIKAGIEEETTVGIKNKHLLPIIHAIIEGGGEYLGTKALAKLFGIGLDKLTHIQPFVGRLAKALAVEMSTEYVQEALQDLSSVLIGLSNKPIEQVFSDATAVLAPTAVMTLATGGLAKVYTPSATPTKTDIMKESKVPPSNQPPQITTPAIDKSVVEAIASEPQQQVLPIFDEPILPATPPPVAIPPTREEYINPNQMALPLISPYIQNLYAEEGGKASLPTIAEMKERRAEYLRQKAEKELQRKKYKEGLLEGKARAQWIAEEIADMEREIEERERAKRNLQRGSEFADWIAREKGGERKALPTLEDLKERKRIADQKLAGKKYAQFLSEEMAKLEEEARREKIAERLTKGRESAKFLAGEMDSDAPKFLKLPTIEEMRAEKAAKPIQLRLIHEKVSMPQSLTAQQRQQQYEQEYREQLKKNYFSRLSKATTEKVSEIVDEIKNYNWREFVGSREAVRNNVIRDKVIGRIAPYIKNIVNVETKAKITAKLDSLLEDKDIPDEVKKAITEFKENTINRAGLLEQNIKQHIPITSQQQPKILRTINTVTNEIRNKDWSDFNNSDETTKNKIIRETIDVLRPYVTEITDTATKADVSYRLSLILKDKRVPEEVKQAISEFKERYIKDPQLISKNIEHKKFIENLQKLQSTQTQLILPSMREIQYPHRPTPKPVEVTKEDTFMTIRVDELSPYTSISKGDSGSEVRLATNTTTRIQVSDTENALASAYKEITKKEPVDMTPDQMISEIFAGKYRGYENIIIENTKGEPVALISKDIKKTIARTGGKTTLKKGIEHVLKTQTTYGDTAKSIAEIQKELVAGFKKLYGFAKTDNFKNRKLSDTKDLTVGEDYERSELLEALKLHGVKYSGEMTYAQAYDALAKKIGIDVLESEIKKQKIIEKAKRDDIEDIIKTIRKLEAKEKKATGQEKGELQEAIAIHRELFDNLPRFLSSDKAKKEVTVQAGTLKDIKEEETPILYDESDNYSIITDAKSGATVMQKKGEPRAIAGYLTPEEVNVLKGFIRKNAVNDTRLSLLFSSVEKSKKGTIGSVFLDLGFDYKYFTQFIANNKTKSLAHQKLDLKKGKDIPVEENVSIQDVLAELKEGKSEKTKEDIPQEDIQAVLKELTASIDEAIPKNPEVKKQRKKKSGDISISFLGTQEIYDRIINAIDNTPKVINYLSEVAHRIYRLGKSFSDFFTGTLQALGDYFVHVEKHLKSIWNSIVEFNKSLGEGGFIQVTPKKKKAIVDLEQKYGTVIIPTLKAWLYTQTDNTVQSLTTLGQIYELAEKEHAKLLEIMSTKHVSDLKEFLDREIERNEEHIAGLDPRIQRAIREYREGRDTRVIMRLNEEISNDKKANIDEWREYLIEENELYKHDIFFRNIVFEELINSIDEKHPNAGILLQKAALATVYDHYQTSKDIIRFAPLYDKWSKEYAKQDTSIYKDADGGHWVHIPHIAHNDSEETANTKIKQLTAISSSTWCVKGYHAAKAYLQEGDFYVYLDNRNKAQVGISFRGNHTIKEIRDINNKETIHEPYIPKVEELIKNANIDENIKHVIDKAKKDAIIAKELKKKYGNPIQEWVNKNIIMYKKDNEVVIPKGIILYEPLHKVSIHQEGSIIYNKKDLFVDWNNDTTIKFAESVHITSGIDLSRMPKIERAKFLNIRISNSKSPDSIGVVEAGDLTIEFATKVASVNAVSTTFDKLKRANVIRISELVSFITHDGLTLNLNFPELETLNTISVGKLNTIKKININAPKLKRIATLDTNVGTTNDITIHINPETKIGVFNDKRAYNVNNKPITVTSEYIEDIFYNRNAHFPNLKEISYIAQNTGYIYAPNLEYVLNMYGVWDIENQFLDAPKLKSINMLWLNYLSQLPKILQGFKNLQYIKLLIINDAVMTIKEAKSMLANQSTYIEHVNYIGIGLTNKNQFTQPKATEPPTEFLNKLNKERSIIVPTPIEISPLSIGKSPNLTEALEKALDKVLAQKGNLHDRLSKEINNILGKNAAIRFVNTAQLAEIIKETGITKEQLDEMFGRHGTLIRDIASIKGITIMRDSSPIILIKRDTPANEYATAFHEVMEALIVLDVLSPNDKILLQKKFSKGKKAWTENASDAFSDFMVLNEVPQKLSAIKTIFTTIKNFAERVVNFFMGYGYRNVNDIFRDIQSGKFRDAMSNMPLEDTGQKIMASIETPNKDWTDTYLNIKTALEKTLEDKKLTGFEKWFINPQWLSRHPVINKLFKIMSNAQDKANQNVYRYGKSYLPLINDYKKRNPEGFKNLTTAILFSDALDYNFGDKYLTDIFKLDEEGIQLYKDTKNFYDAILKEYFFSLKKSEIFSISSLSEYAKIPNSFKAYVISKMLTLTDPDKYAKRIDYFVNSEIEKAEKAKLESGSKKKLTKKEKEDIRRRILLNKFVEIFDLQPYAEMEEFKKLDIFDHTLLINYLDKIHSIHRKYSEKYKNFTSGFYFPRVRPAGRYAVKLYKNIEVVDDETGEITKQWVEISREHTNPSLSKTIENYQVVKMQNAYKKQYKDNLVVIDSKSHLPKLQTALQEALAQKQSKEGANARLTKAEIAEIENRIIFENIDKDKIVMVTEENPIKVPEMFEGISEKAIKEYVLQLTSQLEDKGINSQAIKSVIAEIKNDMNLDFAKRSYAKARFITRKDSIKDVNDIIAIMQEIGVNLSPELLEGRIVTGYQTDIYDVAQHYLTSMMNSASRMEALEQISKEVINPQVFTEIHKDERLYSYVKTYIDSVLYTGNPLSKYAGAAKLLLASWYLGFLRVASAFIQTLQPLITGIPELSTFVDASADDLKTYTPKYRKLSEVEAIIQRHNKAFKLTIENYYRVYNSVMEGNLSEEHKKVLEEGFAGKLATQFISSIRQEVASVLPLYLTLILDKGLYIFQKAEELSRQVGFLSAFELAKEKGLSYSEALEFASKHVDQAYHIYTNINRPLIALKRDWATFTSLAVTLRGYQINYFGWIYNSLRNEHGKVFADKIVLSTLYLMILGGLFAAPLAGDLAKLLAKLLGLEYDIEKHVVNSIRRNFGTTAGRIAEFGILAPLFNIDISKSMRLDLLPQEWSVTGLVDMILGAWRSAGYKGIKFEHAFKRGDVLEMLEALAPVSIEKGIQVFRHKVLDEPLRTMYGSQITDAQGRPIKYDVVDSVATLFGFRPLTMAEASSAYEATKTIKNYFTKKRNSIYEKIKHANSQQKIRDIINTDVKAYNQRVAKYRGAIPIITIDEISEVIKRSRGKPNRLAQELGYQ